MLVPPQVVVDDINRRVAFVTPCPPGGSRKRADKKVPPGGLTSSERARPSLRDAQTALPSRGITCQSVFSATLPEQDDCDLCLSRRGAESHQSVAVVHASCPSDVPYGSLASPRTIPHRISAISLCTVLRQLGIRRRSGTARHQHLMGSVDPSMESVIGLVRHLEGEQLRHATLWRPGPWQWDSTKRQSSPRQARQHLSACLLCSPQRGIQEH